RPATLPARAADAARNTRDSVHWLRRRVAAPRPRGRGRAHAGAQACRARSAAGTARSKPRSALIRAGNKLPTPHQHRDAARLRRSRSLLRMEAATVEASNTARDARGCRISGANARALEHFEDALSCWQSWNRDPHAGVKHALEAAPEFVMAHVLEAQLYLCSRDPAGVGKAHAVLARARLLPQNGRERMHLAVIATELQGEIERSRQLLAALLGEYPRDAVALTAAHALDHFVGDAASLRERVAAVMPHWSSADTGYHALLAMLAFGQEECGDYDRAGDTALRALAIN